MDWERYKDCPATSADGTDHTCDIVVYDHPEDGRCQHNACEGPQRDCGIIVEVRQRD